MVHMALCDLAPKQVRCAGIPPLLSCLHQAAAMPDCSNDFDTAFYCDAENRKQAIRANYRKQWRNNEIAAAFEQVAPLLVETLTFHWSTGQGTRVRHILWSLYTCSHLVNLGDACSGLDTRLSEALAVAIAARLILGSQVEPVIRNILQASGEFRRFDEIECGTPERLPVVYPPAQANAETLRKMADAVDHFEKNQISIGFKIAPMSALETIEA